MKFTLAVTTAALMLGSVTFSAAHNRDTGSDPASLSPGREMQRIKSDPYNRVADQDDKMGRDRDHDQKMGKDRDDKMGRDRDDKMGRDRDDKMGLRGHDDHDRDHGMARDHDKDVR